MTPSRYPPPWSVDDPDPKLERQCFIIRGHNEQSLAYVLFVARRIAATKLTSKYLSLEHQGPTDETTIFVDAHQTNKHLRAVICSDEQQAACLESQKDRNTELRTNSGSVGVRCFHGAKLGLGRFNYRLRDPI